MNEFDIIIIENEAYKVSEAWRRFGGSFIKGLGEALIHADVQNKMKIKTAWPEYWNEGLKQFECIKNERFK